MILTSKAKDINSDLKIKTNSKSKSINNASGDTWLYSQLIVQEVNYLMRLDSLERKEHLLNKNNINKH